MAGYTALPITYNGMIRSGTELYFMTALVEDQDHRISYLLRRRGDDEITSTADLRGRSVGILPTVAYRAWLEALLAEAGVDPAEVTIQQIAPAMQLQALRAGGVDALFTNDPAATSAIVQGIAEPVHDYVEVPRTLGEPFLFGSFNVRKDWADAHPDEATRLAAALDEAVDFVNEHPDEAKRLMRSFLPDAFRDHVARYPDARYLRTDQVEELAFVRAADQCRQRGIIPAALSLSGLVYRAAER
ncbi:MAG: ABC transporter substrate-binding protein [Sandaracinaceae bacterium]|nr:ABC transporter substrate-binding protein [Sandaracinaceae bacterium]